MLQSEIELARLVYCLLYVVMDATDWANPNAKTLLSPDKQCDCAMLATILTYT